LTSGSIRPFFGTGYDFFLSFYFAFLHLSHWQLILLLSNLIGVKDFKALCDCSHGSQLDCAEFSTSCFTCLLHSRLAASCLWDLLFPWVQAKGCSA
jgi:hypothetical protein